MRIASPCPCGNENCHSWHVEPEAAMQGVSFSQEQAVIVAATLDDVSPHRVPILEDVDPTLASQIWPCGSRVTCDPPPTDTDQDYLILVLPEFDGSSTVESNVSRLVSNLSEAGYKWEGDMEHYQNIAGSDFMSWRRGDVNLIVTASHEFARRHRAATALCRRLNILDKAHRVAIFQAVLYGDR